MKEGCNFLVKFNGKSDLLIYRQCMKSMGDEVRASCNNFNCDGHWYPLKDVIVTSIPKMIKHDYNDGDYVYRFIEGYLRKISFHKNHNDEVILPYKWWILYENCKLAVMEISKCLLKSKIYKDVRLLIAKEVWNTRNDYLWRIKDKKKNKKIKV